MHYHAPSSHLRPPRLIVEIRGTPDPVIDEPLERIDRKTDCWHLTTVEFWTPLSIPLRVSIALGARNGLQVWSADVKLLDVAMTDMGLDASLRLPSDEVVRVSLEQRRSR